MRRFWVLGLWVLRYYRRVRCNAQEKPTRFFAKITGFIGTVHVHRPHEACLMILGLAHLFKHHFGS
jgi:hypothetical protein